MTTYSGIYPSILQGVSGMPLHKRSEGTCTEQINLRSSITKGLTKRSPIIRRQKLPDDAENILITPHKDNVNVLYRQGTTLKALDSNGDTHTVSDATYAASGTLKATTIADTAFIINTDTVVQIVTDPINVAHRVYYFGGFNVRVGSPNTTYKLTVRIGASEYSGEYKVGAQGNTSPTDIASKLSISELPTSIVSSAGTVYDLHQKTVGTGVYITATLKEGEAVPTERPVFDIGITSNQQASDKVRVFNNRVDSEEKLPPHVPPKYIGMQVGTTDANPSFYRSVKHDGNQITVPVSATSTVGGYDYWYNSDSKRSSSRFYNTGAPVTHSTIKDLGKAIKVIITLSKYTETAGSSVKVYTSLDNSDWSEYTDGEVTTQYIKVQATAEPKRNPVTYCSLDTNANFDESGVATNPNYGNWNVDCVTEQDRAYTAATSRGIATVSTVSEGETIVEGSDPVLSNWEECSDIFQVLTYDKDTMPHEIDLSTTFKLKAIDWRHRVAGNDDNNKVAGFVGFPIKDLSLNSNRLTILSGNTVSMSVTDDIFNFFRDTVQDVKDTDPLHLTTPISSLDTELYSTARVSGTPYFLGSTGQFYLDYSGIVSPTTATLKEISSYSSLGAPASTGSTALFGSLSASEPLVREIYRNDQGIVDVQDITSTLGTYIKGDIRNIVSSEDDSIAVVQTNDAKRLYVFEWYWQGQKRLVSSWSSWEFQDDIEELFMYRGKLHVVYRNSAGLFLGDIELSLQGDPIYLDDQYTYTSGTIPEGYTLIGNSSYEYPYDVLTDTKDVQGKAVLGKSFTSLYEPSYPILKDPNRQRYIQGTLSMSSMYVTVTDTGAFHTEVDFRGRTIKKTYDIKIGTSKLGGRRLFSSTLKTYIAGDKDSSKYRIKSDSHLGFTMNTLEWRGKLNKRTRSL